MKVSLYVRESGTRKYTKIKLTKKLLDFSSGMVFVLRYGKTWETLDSTSLSDAIAKRLERELALHRGWIRQPTKKLPASLTLDKAKDQYLAEIKNGRKKKTYQAYSIALRYLYECIGNKVLNEISRADMLALPLITLVIVIFSPCCEPFLAPAKSKVPSNLPSENFEHSA